MTDTSKVSAVIVTRGDVDLSRIVDGLPFDDVVIVNNAKEEEDYKVYGRYIGVARAKHPYIYVQDDDCIVDIPKLCEMYRPSELLCNVPYKEIGLDSQVGISQAIAPVGYGAIFPRGRVRYFSEYLSCCSLDDLFRRECDRAFTWINREIIRIVDIGVQHLPCATAPNRMHKELQHDSDEAAMLLRLTTLKRRTNERNDRFADTG